MMFAKMHFPETIPLHKLDDYLAMGWFRMRQTIFTTNFLFFDNRFYSAIWLRVNLAGYQADKKQQELFRRNSPFRVTFRKSTISREQEALFLLYRQSVDFEAADNLQKLLFGNESHNRFDTYTVSVYDGDKLIATGFFDMGKTSAAGITSIYHPDYKKYSLGKYLIYLKIDYCLRHGLQYFYPGYMVPGYTPFDYKTQIARPKLEWLELGSQQWLPFPDFQEQATPLFTMGERLQYLSDEVLHRRLVPVQQMYYRYFDVRLDPSYSGIELFDFPVFLFCLPEKGDKSCRLIVYDVRDGMYHMFQCSSVLKIGFFPETNDIFSSDLLKVDRELVATPGIKPILDILAHANRY